MCHGALSSGTSTGRVLRLVSGELKPLRAAVRGPSLGLRPCRLPGYKVRAASIAAQSRAAEHESLRAPPARQGLHDSHCSADLAQIAVLSADCRELALLTSTACYACCVRGSRLAAQQAKA